MIDPSIDRAKQAAREKVWALLEREGVALLPGAHGRIPNFVGADLATQRLAELDTWKSARVIKSNPDTAQLPVRVKALSEGKLVYMAVPKLATPKPFYLLDPSEITEPFEIVATGDGAAKHAKTMVLMRCSMSISSWPAVSLSTELACAWGKAPVTAISKWPC